MRVRNRLKSKPTGDVGKQKLAEYRRIEAMFKRHEGGVAVMEKEMPNDARIEFIAPQTAQNWLDNQGPNRRLNKERVARLADAIRRGEWQMNGESIKFDTAGKLLDGQHRLAAIVEANIPVPMLVVRNLPRQVFHTIDIGQRRSLSQVLTMRGEHYATQLAALSNLLFVYAGGHDIVTRTHYTPTFEQALRFIDDNPEVRASAAMGARIGQHLKCSILAMGFCHFLFDRLAPNDSELFFNRLYSGAGMSPNDPILVLRNRLTKDGRGPKRLTPIEQIAITVKSWNAFRRGERIQLLSWRGGGSSPESLPEPV